MTQTFSAFGQVTISRNRIEIAYSAGKSYNYKISSDEESTEIPGSAVGKFIFGISEKPSFYTTQEIPGVDLETLPVVAKHIKIILDTVEQLARTSL